MAIEVRTEPIGLLSDEFIRSVSNWLELIARAIVSDEGGGFGEVAIVIVPLAAIQDIHSRYLNDPTPTDVITFPGELDSVAPLDGDIVICLDVAREQAREARHSVEEEIVFLATHGLLHLCGWVDRSPKQRDAMLQRQVSLMARTAPDTVQATPECE